MRYTLPTLSDYRPDYRYRNATHYVVVNRHNQIVAHGGGSKRDAIFNAALNQECAPGSGPYTVVRYTGTSGKLTRLDTIG